MLVVPAIDLRGGKCVRMKQGDPTTEIECDGDPVERAKAFVASGARRLHVIDLDGAFGSGENLAAVARICKAVNVPVQTGGGLRAVKHAEDALAAGASEIILGTLLVEDERLARNIISGFSGRVIAAIDARGSQVAIHGWQAGTPVDRDALVRRVAQWGVTRVIFTEIRRDGMGEGYDIDALNAVANAAEVRVTASGGARSIGDLRELKRCVPVTVDSCIVGTALYNGTIDLEEAIAAVA
jgi:phosphoribosylformimino-5-aminoimidazole carboxamide ribotide isomerase